MLKSSEDARLEALHALDLLDTPPSESFDRITRMTVQLFDLPIAAVSLTDRDRQWFKSRVGVRQTSLPRHQAPCAAVAASARRLVVPDLLDDDDYSTSYLAGQGIRFYAGAPLTTREGHCLGALCVLGPDPRQASDRELAGLSDLAAMVMGEIEQRHAGSRLDPTTLIPNRRQFACDLEELARTGPLHERCVAVMVDLAGPEQLGNAARVMGTAFVDDLIRRAAVVIKAEIGGASCMYHVAATRFVFLGPFGFDEAAFSALLDSRVERLGRMLNASLASGMTLGVASFTLGLTSAADILQTARNAAEDARTAGIRIGHHSLTQDAAHRRRFRLLEDFPAALRARDQLRLVYQPRIDLASNVCVGAEALLRWRHPTLGDIPPGEFIPLVEQTLMIRETMDWVLQAALAQLAKWRRALLDMVLSVNVSAANLSEPDLLDRVSACLDRHALPVGRLELEVTESAVMRDAGQALLMLEALAKAGIRLAIDDFGTGYSSLSYLARLPIHVVKIDRSFVSDIGSDGRRRALLSAMIALLHELGHRVVAEGVETPQVREIVCEAGCDEAQGYLLGRPMEVDDFLAWWRGRHGLHTPGDVPIPALDAIGFHSAATLQ